MTKMAAMQINGKNHKNLLRNQKADDLEMVCSMGYSSTTKFVRMMTQGWPWPILLQDQRARFMNLPNRPCKIGKKSKLLKKSKKVA